MKGRFVSHLAEVVVMIPQRCQGQNNNMSQITNHSTSRQASQAIHRLQLTTTHRNILLCIAEVHKS